MKHTYLHTNIRKGFTIVEVATVLFVIAILALIATMTYNNVQKQSRDTARESAAATIMAALEKYYDKHGEYPYRELLNPTANQIALPNYTVVKQVLPDLTDEVLNTAGYNFYPYMCSTGPTCSTVLAGERQARQKQFFYYVTLPGATDGWINYSASEGMWGCRVYFDDSTPGALLAWKRETDNKWIFYKTNHGKVTIANNGTPTPPTVCELTTV